MTTDKEFSNVTAPYL